MANVFALIIFAAIGSIFGPIGFFIGLGLGILGWIGSSKNKDKGKPVPRKAEAPVFAGSTPPRALQRPAQPSPEQAKAYAIILCFYPSSDSSKVNDVTELLKSDDWIEDKFGTLDTLADRLPHMQNERRDSPMLFQLHSNALIERVLRLPRPMKSRLAMQLGNLLSGLSESDPKDCKDLIDKFRLALRKDCPASSERLEAEDFIMRSGDPQAISTLNEMRRNPSQYRDMLRSGASGNTVLKTAFGVFAGMLAADAVKAAVTDYQMENLLTQLDQDIAKAGGLDRVPLEDKELESLATSESGGGTMSNEDDDISTWENELADVSHDDEGTESLEQDDSEFSSGESSDFESDVDISDSSSDFSFDFDD